MNDINYGNTCYGGVQNNYGTTVGQDPASDEKKKEESTPPMPDQSPSALIGMQIAEFVLSLKTLGRIGKDLLAPYIAAVEIGYAPKLTCEEFNSRYQTDVKSTTYNNWTSPVFHGTMSDKYFFTEHELSYYKTVYNDLM